MGFLLEKQKTGSTPYVYIDGDKGYIKLAGESFHENVIDFFREVNDWLDKYLKSDFSALTFDCAMEYFNSSTAKLLFNMLLNMDEYSIDGKKVTVNWITTVDNDIIIECGEDFEEEMNNLEFNMIIQ
ncbi:MAG: DUF1987 domain-containing protein [Eubacterium sp.]|jgi:hypothetical protein|nr:DUF1987 domain-containing protein [Eubacterium sp.]